MSEDDDKFEHAKKIKGYGSYSSPYLEEEITEEKNLGNGSRIKVTIIHDLKEFVGFIDGVPYNYKNPVFYRGHENANYLLLPSVYRCNIQTENKMIESFYRRFSDEIDACKSEIEKLVLMQHYGLPTRLLDITESPFIALWFACCSKKDSLKKDDNDERWGEIILFQDSDPKSIISSRVSVMSSPAFLNEEFNLWQLGMKWKKDLNFMHDEKFIGLSEVIRNSCIVRVPQNNPRIKNQHGAFIITTANMAYIKDCKDKSVVVTNNILSETKNNNEFSFDDLINDEVLGSYFKKKVSWHLFFKKVVPYSDSNEIEIFKTEPFNINRLLYKRNGVQQVCLIPPGCKQVIINQLAKLNYSEDFIFPDMDNVARKIATEFKN